MKLHDDVFDALILKNGAPKSELYFTNEFECLVCVILSAQCLDRTVNKVTPVLFKKFPTPQKLKDANLEEVANLINQVNFYKNKAKYIIESSKQICDEFGGKVPNTLEDLLKLKGVSRKTAQVVLVEAFNQPAVPVDTHIFRVVNKVFGKTFKTPLETENYIRQNFKKEQFNNLHKLLVLHGRYVCTARKTNCENCVLKSYCKEFEKNKCL